MKFNKAIIICLLILFFTIGAVSAADGNVSEQTDETLSVTPADSLEADESTGSFLDLESLIENTSTGDTLYLEKDYVNDESLPAGINITKGITIDGANHTINANGVSSIFFVNSSNVVFRNINFINSVNYAIRGTCTLYDCSFVDCYSDVFGAAGFDSRGSNKGRAYNCSFTNCYSTSTSGAVYNCNAYNCSFINCYSQLAGALRDGDAYGCYFLNCSSRDGGAIYYTNNPGTIYNCTFIDCSAERYGGAITYFGKISVKNCTFIGCHAGELGGAIRADFKALDGCSFVNCSAGTNGGAICSYILINNAYRCYFEDCSATKYGGAIYNGNVYNSSIINCSAGKSGAAVYKGNAYNCSIIGWYSPGTVIYNGEAYNCTIMESPHIVITTDFATPNQKFDINIALSKNVTGNVTVTLNGETYTSEINAGKAKVAVDNGLQVGTYEISASYAGNSIYSAQRVSRTLVVGKINQQMTVSAPKSYFGKSALISVKMSEDATGYVHIIIEGKDNKVKISNGNAILNVSGIKVGIHNITAKYGGNYKFLPEEASTTFEVLKGTPMTSITAQSITCGNNVTVNVVFSSYVNGYVKITVSNKSIRTKIENHTATASFSGLGTGTYEAIAVYAGNTNYEAQSINTTFDVSKGTPIKSISVKNIKVGHDAVINVQMADNVNGFVKIIVNDITERVQIVDGVATLSVSGLKAGFYNIKAYYAGNKNFNEQSKSKTFSVTKSTPRFTVSTTYSESENVTVIHVSINKGATGFLRVTYEGTTYRLPIQSTGQTDLMVDGYITAFTVNASYGGNYKYTALNETLTFP